jgi:hypothetical protein
MSTPARLCSAIAVALFAIPMAHAADTPKSSVEWDLRVRHESIDDAGFSRNAEATTARLRAGLRLLPAPGWTVFLEGEGIAGAGNYNSGANGKTQYPTVMDPTGAELNQAWIGWKNTQGGVTLGRQRIMLDNQRWVGNVGWRQNEQTFDALATQWKPSASLTLNYFWLDKVHRAAGDKALNKLARERNLDTHLLNLAWKHGSQSVVGYGYLHDDNDVASASTATWGLRWVGTLDKTGQGFGWAAEWARQTDYARNPLHFSHNYWLLEPNWTHGKTTVRAGWEHLGGDGVTALQTPLATVHIFNGWDDQFTVTPAKGLEDRYLGAGGKFGRGKYDGKWVWAVSWHDYRSNVGSLHYGHEWNASLAFPLAGGLNGLVKVADYRANAFSRDNTKLWLQVEWRGTHALAQ